MAVLEDRLHGSGGSRDGLAHSHAQRRRNHRQAGSREGASKGTTEAEDEPTDGESGLEGARPVTCMSPLPPHLALLLLLGVPVVLHDDLEHSKAALGVWRQSRIRQTEGVTGSHQVWRGGGEQVNEQHRQQQAREQGILSNWPPAGREQVAQGETTTGRLPISHGCRTTICCSSCCKQQENACNSSVLSTSGSEPDRLMLQLSPDMSTALMWPYWSPATAAAGMASGSGFGPEPTASHSRPADPCSTPRPAPDPSSSDAAAAAMLPAVAPLRPAPCCTTPWLLCTVNLDV